MNILLRLYIFLWKSKSIFLFLMIVMPFVTLLYLDNYNKTHSIKVISTQALVDDLNDTDLSSYNSNVKIINNEIFISNKAESNKTAKKLVNKTASSIIALISYNDIKNKTIIAQNHANNISQLMITSDEVSLKLNNRLTDPETKNILEKESLIINNALAEEEFLYAKALKQKITKSNDLFKIVNLNKKLNKSNMLINSLILAIVLSAIISILHKLTINSLTKTQDIKQQTGIKALEGLPRFKKIEIINNAILAKDIRISKLTEISRIFKYISNNKKQKVFAVTSSLANEGSSTLTYALAKHAKSFGKVLVIDMNLKNMELSLQINKKIERWDISDNVKNINDKIIRINDCLDFLPAIKDDESVEFLKMSTGLEKLFKHLKSNYDYIFIDTTSIFNVNIHNIDPVILANAADGVIINYLANKTSKNKLTDSIDKLNMANANILAIVTNNKYNPKLKEDLLKFAQTFEKINKPIASCIKVKILKSPLLNEE